MTRRSASRAFRKYGAAGLASLRNRLAYRGNLAGSLLTYGLFVFVFAKVWAAAYAGKSSIAGYTYAMSVWYFIIAEVSAFGFGRLYSTLSQDLKSGQVAYLLCRPYSFVGYHLAQALGQGLLDVAILLAEGIVAGLILAGPPPEPGLARGLAVLLSLGLAGVLQFYLQVSLAMTAFWVEENSAFFWIYQKLTLVVGTLLPLEFLPDAARRVALVTPLPSLTYAPSRIAVAAGTREALGLLLVQVAWILGAAALSTAIFATGRTKLSVQGG